MLHNVSSLNKINYSLYLIISVNKFIDKLLSNAKVSLLEGQIETTQSNGSLQNFNLIKSNNKSCEIITYRMSPLMKNVRFVLYHIILSLPRFFF